MKAFLSSSELWTVVSRVLTTGIFDEYAAPVDTCHVVGSVHLYKYWPLVRFPRTIGNVMYVKRITNVRPNMFLGYNVPIYGPCMINTVCRFLSARYAHKLANSPIRLRLRFQRDVMSPGRIIPAFVKYNSRAAPALAVTWHSVTILTQSGGRLYVRDHKKFLNWDNAGHYFPVTWGQAVVTRLHWRNGWTQLSSRGTEHSASATNVEDTETQQAVGRASRKDEAKQAIKYTCCEKKNP